MFDKSDRACAIAEKWRNWMRLELYSKADGTLKKKWNRRIDLYKNFDLKFELDLITQTQKGTF